MLAFVGSPCVPHAPLPLSCGGAFVGRSHSSNGGGNPNKLNGRASLEQPFFSPPAHLHALPMLPVVAARRDFLSLVVLTTMRL